MITEHTVVVYFKHFEIPSKIKSTYNTEQYSQDVKYTLTDGSRLNETKCQMFVPNTFAKRELDPVRIRKDLHNEAIELQTQPCELFHYYATEGANYLYDKDSSLLKLGSEVKPGWSIKSSLPA